MEILPVVKLIEQDLEPLEAENDSASEGSPRQDIQVDQKALGREVDKPQESSARSTEGTSGNEVLPEVKKGKPTLHEEDIFTTEEKPKETKTKTRKPRKPMTEAQKENLKKAREKALAVRRAKAEEKKEIKVLKEKKKKKEIQQLRDEVEDTPKKAVSSEAHLRSTTPLPTTLQSLDPELIRKLQQDAIEGYDKIRKERKAKKKQEQETQNRNTTNMNRINNALNPPKSVKYGDAGFFSHLF